MNPPGQKVLGSAASEATSLDLDRMEDEVGLFSFGKISRRFRRKHPTFSQVQNLLFKLTEARTCRFREAEFRIFSLVAFWRGPEFHSVGVPADIETNRRDAGGP